MACEGVETAFADDHHSQVFSADSALWWSPDASKLAYLSFDEHDVPEYEFPIYNPSPWTPGADPYPTATVMRYPKVSGCRPTYFEQR